MENFFRFFARYYLFVMFLMLEALCFYMIYNNSHFHKVIAVNSVNDINGKVYETQSNITSYFYLKSRNDSLQAENAFLRAHLKESIYDDRVQHGVFTDTIDEKEIFQYKFIPSMVIKNSVNEASNYIFINKGSLHGIHKQMGVINSKGVVGQVVDVTPHYACVMSLLNKNFKMSAKLKHSKYFGQLYWDGVNAETARLDEIPKHVKVKDGDTIITSGYSALFPENIMIGTVKKFNSQADKNFVEIDVKLSANMHTLDHVYVVENFFKKEYEKLDSLTQKLSK